MDFVTIILYTFVLIVGLCIGSFLNVVILRALSDESIVFPASKCPKCQTPLKWWHNIPLVSYVFLKGKCAFCKEHISIQYPIIEFLTGMLFVMCVYKFGFNINAIYAAAIGCILIVIAGTDWKEKVVFDFHCFLLICIALIYSFCFTAQEIIHDYTLVGTVDFSKDFIMNSPFIISILGAITGFCIMKAFEFVGKLIAGVDAFGDGDSLITTGIGAVFGWKSFIGIFILSILLIAILSLPIMIIKTVKNKNFKPTVSLVTSIAALAVFEFITDNFDLNIYLLILLTACVFVPVIIFSYCLINDVRKNPQTQTYLPFGPALIIAAFIFMFGFVG